MKLGTFIAILVLMAGIGVQVFGIGLILSGEPKPIMMLSWVVPIYMSANHLIEAWSRAHR